MNSKPKITKLHVSPVIFLGHHLLPNLIPHLPHKDPQLASSNKQSPFLRAQQLSNIPQSLFTFASSSALALGFAQVTHCV